MNCSNASPAKEYVFVDGEPRFSLSFYLDAEIEDICMRGSCAAIGLAKVETVDTELRSTEKDILYLVAVASLTDVNKRIEALGYQGIRLGMVRDVALVELSPRAVIPQHE